MNAEDQAILEMQKPIGVALMPLEWFVLLAFFDHLQKNEDALKTVFSSQEDYNSLMKICETIHRQAFPPKKDNLEALAETLEIKPKKIITKPDLVL